MAIKQLTYNRLPSTAIVNGYQKRTQANHSSANLDHGPYAANVMVHAASGVGQHGRMITCAPLFVAHMPSYFGGQRGGAGWVELEHLPKSDQTRQHVNTRYKHW